MDLAAVSPSQLRHIFSTRALREIATTGVSERVNAVIREVLERGSTQPSSTLAQLYEESFKVCAKSQKVEYVYKNALVEKFLLGRHSLQTAAALFELAVGGSKLDALLVTSEMSAYEIKTERDELSRLVTQLASYRKAFRKIWVFTCDKHASSAARILPSATGIVVLGKRYRMQTLREAVSDSNELCCKTMLALLRRRELLTFLQTHHQTTDIPNTHVLTAAVRFAERLNPEDVNDFVGKQLRARGLSNTSLARQLPRSLGAAALALALTEAQSSRLITHLQMPLSEAIN